MSCMDMRGVPYRRLSSEELMLAVLEKILESLSRRSNQSILKEGNPEYSLEELILKLKLQYFGYLMRRASSLEKTDAGKE